MSFIKSVNRRSRSSSARYKKGREAKYAEELTGEDDYDDGQDSGIWTSSARSTIRSSFSNRSNHPMDFSSSDMSRCSIRSDKSLPIDGNSENFQQTCEQLPVAFSALTQSMWPQEMAASKNCHYDANDEVHDRYDEFGFRVEHGGITGERHSRLLSVPFTEDPRHKLKWIAHLEFTHTKVIGDLTWDKIDPILAKTEKLQEMIYKGVPHSLRPHIWPRLCGSMQKKKKATFKYNDLLKSANKDKPSIVKQIEKDLLRTLPTNACFASMDSVGVPIMRRILRALAYLYPEIGYCQGMGVIVGTLLLFKEEEDTFWLMVTIIR